MHSKDKLESLKTISQWKKRLSKKVFSKLLYCKDNLANGFTTDYHILFPHTNAATVLAPHVFLIHTPKSQ